MSIKRISLPLWMKYDIINEVNRRNGMPLSMLAKELEISRTSLITILKNKEKIIEDFKAGCSSETKRKRKHNFEAVDEPLAKWFRQARDEEIPVSEKMLLLKAQEYAAVYGCENPEKLNMSWIKRWKMRKDIVCKKLHGEAESVDQNGISQWQTNYLPTLLKQLKAEDIFNADEAGLFYQCLPDRKNKRTSLPLWKKYDIINEVNRRNGMPLSMLAKELEISRTSLITILKNKEKIIEDFEAGCSSKTKRKRKHNFEAVDEPLVKWFCQAIDEKIPISGEMLLLKAQEYAEVCGCENPKKLNMSWINRWKVRKDIVCKTLHSEAESFNQNGINGWRTNCLPALLKQFKAEDIFNADETGLFYRCLPDGTSVFKNEKCAGGKLSKERLTVLVTVSMAGEKLPLLVIGKLGNQRYFKNTKKLPLPFESNKKGWMTAVIFEMWVKKLDSQMRKSNRSIALVLDNCAAHPKVKGLTNIKLIFLPPNTTARTQPVNAGVIQCLKSHYRKNLVKMCLVAFEEKKDFMINVLEGTKLLSNAWNAVSEATIKNCFKKVNFIQIEDSQVQEVQTEDDDDDDDEVVGIWERLQAGGLIPERLGFTDYATCDDGLLTHEMVTETSILNEVTAIDDQEDEDDDAITVEDIQPGAMSPFEALSAIRQLDLFFRSRDNHEDALHSLAQIQQQVLNIAVTKSKH